MMILLPTTTNSMLSISNSITLNSKSKSASNHQLPTSSIDSLTINHKKRRCECFDLHRTLIPYNEAWNWQKGIVKAKKVLKDKNEDFVDSVFVLQHPHVYTLGTGSSKDNFNFDMHHPPFDIFQTERGGEVTYHGPGQLVMYPVINLRYHKMDLHWYLRSLEEVIIRVLYSSFSIKASRIDGFTGVWVGDQKLAAIGVRVSQWITYHGLALNVTTDLTLFEQIVPCGIRDRRVGSIKGLLGSRVADYGDDCQLIDIAYNSMMKEFSEVFQFELQEETISLYKSYIQPSV